MISKNNIRFQFSLIMLSVIGFSIFLTKFLPGFGVETYLLRTVLVFICSYVWFFLMIKIWLLWLETRPSLFKQVAEQSQKEKSHNSFASLDFQFLGGGDVFGVVFLIIGVLVFTLFAGYAVSIEAPILLMDAAFEAAIAGGLIRTIKSNDDGSWVKVVFKRTIFIFMSILILGSVFAWQLDRFCHDNPSRHNCAYAQN